MAEWTSEDQMGVCVCVCVNLCRAGHRYLEWLRLHLGVIQASSISQLCTTNAVGDPRHHVFDCPLSMIFQPITSSVFFVQHELIEKEKKQVHTGLSSHLDCSQALNALKIIKCRPATQNAPNLEDKMGLFNQTASLRTGS